MCCASCGLFDECKHKDVCCDQCEYYEDESCALDAETIAGIGND